MGDPASAASFAPAATEAEEQTSPLPADESPAGAVEEAPPALPEYGDFTDPPPTAVTPPEPEPAPEPDPAAEMSDLDDFDKDSAPIVERSEYEQTYQGPGESKVTEFSDVPLNVEVDGEWKPVLTEVEGRGPFAFLGLGGAQVEQHPLAPKFAEHADESPVLAVSRGGYDVSFQLVDAAAAARRGGDRLRRAGRLSGSVP